MKPEDIDIHSIEFNPVKLGTTFSQPPLEPSRPVPQQDRDVVKTPPMDHIQFNQLQTSNIQSQDMAKKIREVHETMEEIDGQLQQTQSHLYGIVKMYPPYPPGSSERVEALRQFSALRNMIDRLVTPTGADDMKKIMADPVRSPQAGDWNSANENSSPQLTIHHQPIHSGKGGLDLPEPTGTGTDAQLSILLDRTIAARQTLTGRRRAFAADANRIITQMS